MCPEKHSVLNLLWVLCALFDKISIFFWKCGTWDFMGYLSIQCCWERAGGLPKGERVKTGGIFPVPVWVTWDQPAGMETLTNLLWLTNLIYFSLGPVMSLQICSAVWADPGWMPDPHQSFSFSPLLRWTGRENIMRGSWVETRAGRHRSSNTIMGNSDLN